MSMFCRMHITVGKELTDTGGRFHEITVEDHHDSSTLGEVMDCFDEAGYELVSVVIDGWDFTEDMYKHVKWLSNIVPLFEALCDDLYQADMICAWLIENDCADVANWADHVCVSGTSYEDVVRDWVGIFHKVYEQVPSRNYYGEPVYVETDPFPNWMEIDWEETLHQIARENSSSVVEFNDMIFFFGE